MKTKQIKDKNNTLYIKTKSDNNKTTYRFLRSIELSLKQKFKSWYDFKVNQLALKSSVYLNVLFDYNMLNSLKLKLEIDKVKLEIKNGELKIKNTKLKNDYNKLKSEYNNLLNDNVKKLTPNTLINSIDVKYLLNKKIPNANIYMADNKLGLFSKEDLMNVLLKDNTNKKKYTKEVHDCDNFAVDLLYHLLSHGLSAGILWITKPYAHALNVIILSKKGGGYECKLIEPQTDRVFDVPSDYVGTFIMYMR